MKNNKVRFIFIQSIKHIFSFLIVGVFLNIGYILFFTKKTFTETHSELLRDWLWWLCLITFVVVISLYGSAVPAIQSLIGSLISLRTGKHEKNNSPQNIENNESNTH